jgi:MoxR-like ATPase
MEIEELNEMIKNQYFHLNNIQQELKKTIIGQTETIKSILIGLISEGHVLLEGFPGLAKTKIITSLSACLNLHFKRIQFTPDLLPSDITGTKIYNQQSSEFSTKKGPIFANIILADEINRAPAKVQSSLLEAMQEKQVTIGEETFQLPNPFFVLATQNPLEQEGTYPLPEAQLDRFLLKIEVNYPSKKEELEVINLMENEKNIQKINPVINQQELTSIKDIIPHIYLDNKLKEYIIEIVNATRNPADYNLSKIQHLIKYGVSPRASISLLYTAKANALLEKRGYVIPDDIKAVAKNVMRHRIGLSFEAEAENVSSGDIIESILNEIDVP